MSSAELLTGENAASAIRVVYPAPVAYTYDADTHCPRCTALRFGVEAESGFVPESATDSEGNTIGAVAPWDEYLDGITCGTCLVAVREPEPARFVVVENTPGYLPESEGSDFDELADAERYADELAREIANDYYAETGYVVAVEKDGARLWRVATGAPHVLGRVVEIIERTEAS